MSKFDHSDPEQPPEGTNGHVPGGEIDGAALNGSGPSNEAQEPQSQESGLQAASEDGDEGAPQVLGHVCEGAPEADLQAVEKYKLAWDQEGKFWRNERKQRICGAHPKWARGPCRAASLYQNGRCHYHGGPTPSGIASVHYRTGRWSTALNGKRREHYLSAKDDPDLMDLGRPLALLDTNVAEAVERLEGLDTPDFRKRALTLYIKARRLMQKDPKSAGTTLTELGELLQRGAEEDRAREEVGKATSRMARHMEAAWKVRLGAAQAINASDLTAILGAFIEVAADEMEGDALRTFLKRIDREVLSGRLAAAGVNADSKGRGDQGVPSYREGPDGEDALDH